MAAALSTLPCAAVVRLAPRGRAASRLIYAAAAGEASTPSPAPRRLVLYTKPRCCLCDGLKEKLPRHLLAHQLAPLPRLPRAPGKTDITTNLEEWLYQYEIRVLAKVLLDGSKLDKAYPRDFFQVGG